MKSKLIWTKEDRIIFHSVLDYAKNESRSTGKSINSLEEMIICLRQASDVSGRKICNDCPDHIASLLTKNQWRKVWVEFHHYNGDIEEIGDPSTHPLPDFCLYYFFSHKLSEIKTTPQSYPLG